MRECGRVCASGPQVNELTMQNEYQLRLKDLNTNERIKDLTEKFTHELETDKAKFELLLQEKNEMEMEYEEKLKQSEERHGGQMHAQEGQYQQKIMSEVCARMTSWCSLRGEMGGASRVESDPCAWSALVIRVRHP